jgi:hypothetical protein
MVILILEIMLDVSKTVESNLEVVVAGVNKGVQMFSHSLKYCYSKNWCYCPMSSVPI